MIAALLAALALVARVSPPVPLARGGENSVALAAIELEGPLAGVVLELAAAGETRLVGVLQRGERRTMVVPIAARGPIEGLTPQIRWGPAQDQGGGGSGRARFLRWVERIGSDYEELPPALRARPRPPLERPANAPSTALALSLAALFVAGASLRRRTAAAVLVALTGVVVVLWLGPRPDPTASAHLVLIEGDGSSAHWIEVEGALDRLEVRGLAELPNLPQLQRLEVEPQDARITWRVPLESEEPARVESRGARIYRVRVFDPGDLRPTRAENRLERSFAETWLRSAGTWTAHGVWGSRRPWPAAAIEGGAPPGWLASGLPQGPSVLLGRLSGEPATWVRITGF